MAQGRDWRRALRQASYKGVPFQTERDEEEGSRRLVSHEFPMRDVPFNEDLGEGLNNFEVTAYVASNAADAEASALVAVCRQRGPGLLVLPMQGGILVRLKNWRRAREKDRGGYVAFSLSFVREGAASALTSIASLANLVLVGADRLSASIDAFLSSALSTLGLPDFVVSAASDAIVDGAAILEAIRIGEAVDPAVSAPQRLAINAIASGAPAAVVAGEVYSGTAGADLAVAARALSGGMIPTVAIAAFGGVIDQAVVADGGPFPSASARSADTNRRAVYLAIRVAAACAYADAIALADIPDRQAAIALRAAAAERFEAILRDMTAADADLYHVTTDLMGATIEYLSRAVLDRAPIVPVGANRRMPSLWWANRLYADAGRAAELVERNRVPHPSFMPTAFDAVIE